MLDPFKSFARCPRLILPIKIFAFSRIPLLAALCMAALQGCDYLPSNSPPATFENDIVQFEYPDNWEVSDGGAAGGLQYVIIDGPSSTEIILQIYPREGAPSLNEFAQWFSQEFRQAVAFGSIEKISFSEVTKNLGTLETTGIRENFSLTVIGIGVAHSREYFAIETDNLLIFLVFQIADDGARLWGEQFTQIQESLVFK